MIIIVQADFLAEDDSLKVDVPQRYFPGVHGGPKHPRARLDAARDGGS